MLLHFVQLSFQPWCNCRLATCQYYHKRVKSAQNPLVTLRPQFVAWLSRLSHYQTQNTSAQILDWSIDASLLQPCFLFIWVGVEPKCRFHSLSGPLARIGSSLLAHDSTDGFPHSLAKCLMWFMLTFLWLVLCSTLHHFLRLSACFRATCATMFDVPTLAVHIFLTTPAASTSRAHIVKVCPKCSFGSTTPRNLWDHFKHI